MNRLLHRALASAAFSLLAAQAMHAREFTFGGLVGIAAPTGDFKDAMDSVLGAGLGPMVLVDFGGGHGLRPSLECWASKRTETFSLNNISVRGSLEATMVQVGADYLYGLNGALDRGFYVLGGVGASRNEVKISGSIQDFNLSASDTTTRAYFRLGAGYQFLKWFGTELRYSTTRSPGAKNDAIDMGTVNLAATFRF